MNAEPLTADDLTLTHENISALFGRTNGGAKLVEQASAGALAFCNRYNVEAG